MLLFITCRQASALQPWVFNGLAPLTSRWLLGDVAALSALVQPQKSAPHDASSAALPYTSQALVSFRPLAACLSLLCWAAQGLCAWRPGCILFLRL